EQRRLPDPVRTEDHQPIAAAHVEIDAVQHPLLPVRLHDPTHLQHFATTRPTLLEPELRITSRAPRQLLQLLTLLLDHPEPALRLPGLARLRPEPVHELLVPGDLLLPTDDLLLSPLPLRDLLLEKRRIVAPVERHRCVIDVQDGRGDVVEELVIV